MKKKKFMAVAAAVAMAAITAFSVGNTPSVKAADVTSKTPMDLVIEITLTSVLMMRGQSIIKTEH